MKRHASMNRIYRGVGVEGLVYLILRSDDEVGGKRIFQKGRP